MRIIMVVITEVMYSPILIPISSNKEGEDCTCFASTKVNEKGDITLITNHTHLCIEAIECRKWWFWGGLFTNDKLRQSIIEEIAWKLY